MTQYRLLAETLADLDVESAFHWYASQRAALGVEFLDELRATYDRIAYAPLAYQDVHAGIRRALLRRFPYAVYFVADGEVVVVLAVLHASRDPAEWQRRSDRPDA